MVQGLRRCCFVLCVLDEQSFADSLIYKHLKGRKLGNLLGDSWFRKHDQYKGVLFYYILERETV